MTDITATGKRRTLGGSNLAVWVASTILLLMLLLALVPPLAGADPFDQDLMNSLRPPFFVEGGSTDHLLGTDNLGRDVFARLSAGIRSSVAVSTLGLALALGIGVGVGVFAGYTAGRVDDVLMRFVDIQLSIPPVLLVLMIAAVLNPTFFTVAFALGLVGWIVFARVSRAQVLSLREQELVLAMRSLGARHVWVMFRHVLPNIVGPIIVIATLELATLMIAEAALGFLGLGVPPPTPTLGSMIATGQEEMLGGGWWLVVIPGAAIALLIGSINVLGDALRDRLDPTHGA